MSAIVRRATVADLTTLRLLWAEMYDENPPAYPGMDPGEYTQMTAQLADLLCRPDDTPGAFFRAFVLEVDGRDVGFCAGELKGRGFGLPRLFGAPHWLYVQAPYRSLGHGRHLARVCIEYLASLGLDMIEVQAMVGDEQWMRRGFVPVSVLQVARASDVLATIAAKDAEEAAKREAARVVEPEPPDEDEAGVLPDLDLDPLDDEDDEPDDEETVDAVDE